MIEKNKNIPNFAAHWAEQLGGRVCKIEQLKGGINNRVFRCSNGNKHWVVKGYSLAPFGQRDRMQSEVDFLRYAALTAPCFTPKLLKVDLERRCVVLEHIEGEIYPEGVSPSQRDLKSAISFFRKLNSNQELAKEMIHFDAAESYLSLRQHMANVRERLKLMCTEHLPNQYKAQAALMLYDLHMRADDVETMIEDQIDLGTVDDLLNPEDRCVSPSDFGFHNAICIAENVKFIDFEFSGWDDPSKACVDFILQQRNSILMSPINIASKFFPGREVLIGSRINAISEILKLKWHCIILGIFNPARLTQITELGQYVTQEAAVATQLRRHHEYIRLAHPS